MGEGNKEIRGILLTELEKTRSEFRQIIASLKPDELKRMSLNPGWTNGEVLTHMTFGMMILVTLMPIARTWGRLPRGSSKWFAWLLNSLTTPFNWVNALGARGQGKVFGSHRLERLYDWVHFSILKQMKTIQDDEWAHGMYYPTRWDANFAEFMTLDMVIRYAMIHFEFHAKQIAR
jgi:hypothetical protein